MPSREPRNPLYLLLLLASLLVRRHRPGLRRGAGAGGEGPRRRPSRRRPRPSAMPCARTAGAGSSYEVAAMVVFGLLSMVLDRLRRLQKERAEATIPPPNNADPSV